MSSPDMQALLGPSYELLQPSAFNASVGLILSARSTFYSFYSRKFVCSESDSSDVISHELDPPVG
jgi:hypothetical protein